MCSLLFLEVLEGLGIAENFMHLVDVAILAEGLDDLVREQDMDLRPNLFIFLGHHVRTVASYIGGHLDIFNILLANFCVEFLDHFDTNFLAPGLILLRSFKRVRPLAAEMSFPEIRSWIFLRSLLGESSSSSGW